MMSDTCTFSYIAAKDSAPKTATGIERSWLDLKIEFSRQGEGLAGAKYYKTISPEGPQLFAVKFDETVWYHDQNRWHKYQTARDIQYNILASANSNLPRKNTHSTTDDDDDDDEPHFGVEDEN